MIHAPFLSGDLQPWECGLSANTTGIFGHPNRDHAHRGWGYWGHAVRSWYDRPQPLMPRYWRARW